MFDLSTRDPSPLDPLFFERLEAFMDKCLADIRAFAEREARPFEETRQYIAEWHSKYLFNPPLPGGDQATTVGATTPYTATKVRSVLFNASRLLESLHEVSGIESFVLAVDPADPSDEGFLGGTLAGREFWRGLRGGGSAGAKTFKAYCCKQLERQQALPSIHNRGEFSTPSPSLGKGGSSRSLKSELYDAVRTALRTSSGVRNAEMKWSNHERLDVYGVRLVGWPPDIPTQNPSALKVKQNKQIMEALRNGTLRFEKIFPAPSDTSTVAGTPRPTESDEDFSWAYDPDAGDSQGGPQASVSSPPAETTPSQGNPRPPSSAESVNFDSWIHSSPDASRSNSMEPPSRKRQRQLSNDDKHT